MKEQKVLELQEAGKDRDEIANLVGYKGKEKGRRDNLMRFMRSRDYTYEDDLFVKQEDKEDIDDGCHQKDDKKDSKVNPSQGKVKMEVDSKICRDDILDIVKQDSEIKEMLEYFQSIKSNLNDDRGAYSDDKITVDLDSNEEIRTTVRVNKKVWDDFKVFCDDNSHLKMKDLMGMALKEYIERYK